MRSLSWLPRYVWYLLHGARAPRPAAGLLALLLMSNLPPGAAQAVVTIPIVTESAALVLQTDASQRLNTVYFGLPLATAADYAGAAAQYNFRDANTGIYANAYTPAGTWNLAEPALEVTHADGNPSLELRYVRHSQENTADQATLTRIVLRDPVYPFEVTLCYKAWRELNVLEQWVEIAHHEKKPVVLQKYASANLYFPKRTASLPPFRGSTPARCSPPKPGCCPAPARLARSWARGPCCCKPPASCWA